MPRLHELILQAAARHPERTALRTPAGARLGYAALADGIARVGAELRSRDVAGGRVGLLAPNLAAFPAAFYGALSAGASVVLLNPLYVPRELAEYLQKAEADTVLTTAALAPLLPAGVHALDVERLAAPPASGAGMATAATAEPPLAATPDDAEAVVIFTHAVDGWARGARLSHRNLVANLRSTVAAMRLAPDDRMLAVLPFVHSFGLTVTLNAPLSVGAAVLPVERFHPLRVLETIEAGGATVLCGVPGVYLGLLAAAARRGVPRHRVRLAICGGAPLPPELAERWEKVFGVPLREGYGLTEGSPVCAFNHVERPNRPGTLGEPFPGVEISIRDGAGRRLPAGAVGEICVRGENVFLGYVGEHDPPELRGGFLHTGDLGSCEPDGRLRFRGMLKPLFTRNGFNVYPPEIARVLQADARIAGVRVCGLPDAAKENELVLFVRPAPGAVLSEADVHALCRTGLAAYKRPEKVVIEAE